MHPEELLRRALEKQSKKPRIVTARQAECAVLGRRSGIQRVVLIYSLITLLNAEERSSLNATIRRGKVPLEASCADVGEYSGLSKAQIVSAIASHHDRAKMIGRCVLDLSRKELQFFNALVTQLNSQATQSHVPTDASSPFQPSKVL